MDAHALLTSQGWRGAGHSLHATSDAIGLSKPLLLNRRDGNKGIGQKAHYTSDQWWMNAFDEQLQGLSTTTGTDGKLGVVQAVQNGGRIGGVEKGAGGRWKLGGCFVKGGFLEGTIAQIEREEKLDDEEEATTSEDSATGTLTPVGGGGAKESKAQRKARRATRRAEREAKRQRKEARRVLKASQTSSKSSSKRASSDEDSDKSKRDETKEERRARREAKRIRRAAREARKTG